MQHQGLDMSPVKQGTLAVRTYATKRNLARQPESTPRRSSPTRIGANGQGPSHVRRGTQPGGHPGDARRRRRHRLVPRGVLPHGRLCRAESGCAPGLRKLAAAAWSSTRSAPKEFHRINTGRRSASRRRAVRPGHGLGRLSILCCAAWASTDTLPSMTRPADFNDQKSCPTDPAGRCLTATAGRRGSLQTAGGRAQAGGDCDYPAAAGTRQRSSPRCQEAAKRQAVADTLGMPVTGDHPGTILRTHPNSFFVP